LYATRFTIDAMRRGGGGAIVNMSSISALWHGRAKPGVSIIYDAAKAGVLRISTGLAWLAENDPRKLLRPWLDRHARRSILLGDADARAAPGASCARPPAGT
jgi:hypothetical protein